MNSKKKGIIIGLAAVVLLAVVMVVLLLTQNDNTAGESSSSNSSEELTYAMIEKNVDDLESITFTNETGSYAIKTLGIQKYGIEEFADFIQLESAYDIAVSNLCALDASQKVFDSVEDKAKYGLDDPAATAVLKFKDGSEVVLNMGDISGDNSGYYAMVEGDPALYIVNTPIGDTLTKDKFEYLDTTLIPTYEAEESEESGTEETTPTVTEFSLTKKGWDKPVVLRKVTEQSEDRTYPSDFEMVSPIGWDAHMEVGTNYITPFFGTAADSVKAIYQEADAAVYGFDDPTAVIELTYDGKTAKLVVGDEVPAEVSEEETSSEEAPASSGIYYVLCNDNGLVYEVSKATLVVLDVTPEDMISKLAVLPNISAVNKTVLELDGKTYTFEIVNKPRESEESSSESSEDEEPILEVTDVTCDGKKLDVTEFKAFYRLLLSASVEEINTTPVEGEADASITYYYTKGGTEEVKIHIIDERNIQLNVNGEWEVQGRRAYLTKLQTELEHLLNDEKVDTDW